MSELSWQFEFTHTYDGPNNPLLEHFSGNFHLAREVIQNSIDAGLKGIKKPVLVEFKLEEFAPSQFPGFDQFQTHLERIHQFYSKEENSDEKALEFISNAHSCLKSKTIPVLRVSDYNTTGLKGRDNEIKSSWFSLVRSKGFSSKASGEGGSFGIGKGAAYKVSNLRTVFYSTYNELGRTIFQGVSELVSFVDENSKIYSSKGYFGRKGFESVRNPKELPMEFRRAGNKTGLDIFIPGFINERSWQQDIIESVLRNFWYSIYCDELEVIVGEECINSESLEKLLVNHFEGKKFRDDIEPVGNPLQYYKTVVFGEHQTGKLPLVGEVSFYYNKVEEYMKHVAMMRKSHMVIYSRHFNHPDSFSGVFICDDLNGNEELRKMEPPTHNRWDAERNKSNGSKILDEISQWIRGCLKDKVQVETAGTQEITDLHQYLPYDEDQDVGGSKYGSRAGIESETETASLIQERKVFDELPAINPYSVATLNEETETGGMDPDEPRIPGNGGGGGNRNGEDSGGATSEHKKGIRKGDVYVRIFRTGQNGSEASYKVILRATRKIKCDLRLFAAGEEGTELIKILKAADEGGEKLRFRKNRILQIALETNSRKTLNVDLETPFKISLKSNLHEI